MQKRPLSILALMPVLLIILLGLFPGTSFSQQSFFDSDKVLETELNYPDISGFYTDLSNTDSIFFAEFQYGWQPELLVYNPVNGKSSLHYPAESNYVLSKNLCEDCVFKRILWTYQPSSSAEAGNCQIQMGCPEAANYLILGSSVCRITALIDGFVFFSTGVLVNNTANDGRPLLLTAEHNG